MSSLSNLLLLLALSGAVAPRAAVASVVINEVFYNAPDDLDDLQWVELHNTAGRPADVSGWTLDDGRLYTFPANIARGHGDSLPALASHELVVTGARPVIGAKTSTICRKSIRDLVAHVKGFSTATPVGS